MQQDSPGVGVATEPAPFEFIDQHEHLLRWIEGSREHMRQSGETRVCLDTEADSLHHYNEKLCLLQVACGTRYALVDPLAIDDVGPLLQLLDEYDLWLHGADYDLTLLLRTYQWQPKRVHDTQIAARLAGARQFGLAALLQSVLGVTVNKASQKADWSQRPLPPPMLAYAVDDVRYLLRIADHFMAMLKERNRTEWFAQSCAALQQDVAQRSAAPREDPWRVQGSGRLNPKGLAILKAMWMWRETIAQERDIPCYRVMSNKQMVGYAELFEKGGVMNPPHGWRPRWKTEFHQLVASVFRQGQMGWPQRQKRVKGRLNEAQRDAVDSLCARRDQVASQLDIEGSLLGSRSDLEAWLAAGGNQAETSPLMPWQEVIMGPILSEVLPTGDQTAP
jgi:ribonuclease D